MINTIVLPNVDNMVLFRPSEGKAMSLSLGDLLSADVLDIIESGMVSLRITPPVGKAMDSQAATLLVYTNVPLTEGDKINLEVVGTGKEVKLRFLGVEQKSDNVDNTSEDPVSAKVNETVKQLSDARVDTSDFKVLKDMLSNLPQSIKNTFPEIGRLLQTMPDMKDISMPALKANIENSGVLFETKIKDVALNESMGVKELVGEALQKAVEGVETLDLNDTLSNTLDTFISKAESFLTQNSQLPGLQTAGPQAAATQANATQLPAQQASTQANSAQANPTQVATQANATQQPAAQVSAAQVDVMEAVPEFKSILSDLKSLVGQADKQAHSLNEKELVVVIKQRLDEAVSLIDKPATGKEKLDLSHDQKALLLKAKDIVEQDRIGVVLRHSGASKDEITSTIDKFLKNIEHYQINSRANDTIYTFLPFSWPEMKDGQLLFKKNKYHAKKSFSCDINLDLGSMGKLSVSTTVSEGSFFISFHAEKKETTELIANNRTELENRFHNAGLSLKVINIGQKKTLNIMENLKEQGLNLRV
ncbi:MAG: flagellar hook-length control protein FliK [Nitrospirae bacterium]|nr:flagellar hook-length control protein FliK [Nitrospirota bacterium]MBF0533540.1 flagellar hook-length control protein FliK [Nitrospirota bacterium]MBF0615936.1 flagellar hook-length control protein FliK [Nitrospirota bacterium]